MLFAASGCDSQRPSPARSDNSFTIRPGVSNIRVGEKLKLSAVSLDDVGNASRDSNVNWSSSNAAVATVSQFGVVAGISLGSATIRATSKGSSATARIRVSAGDDVSAIVAVDWDCGGLRSDAVGSDLWPITWSDDDNQYTAWGDGEGFQAGTYVSYGIARIAGGPSTYSAKDVFEGPPGSGHGKISGIISLGGVLYLWRSEQDSTPPTHTLIRSVDKGRSLAATSVRFPRAGAPRMVPGPFINFGSDNADAVDRFVYSTAGDWLTASPTYLIRVAASELEHAAAYEVFSGTVARPRWSTNFAERQPIYTDSTATSGNGATHAVITYIRPLRRYLLTTHPKDDLGSFTLLSSPKPWGPWTRVASYTNWCGWEGQAVRETLPKFISPKWVSADGSVFWLVFSGTESWDRFNLVQGKLQVR